MRRQTGAAWDWSSSTRTQAKPTMRISSARSFLKKVPRQPILTANADEHAGKGAFSVRKAVLGHLQQGGEPSPRDRIRATAMATYAIEHCFESAPSPSGKEGDTVAPPSVCIGEI